MKKLYFIGLTLLAVFAFSSVLVASASAETTLLAEWLFNGAAVTGTLTTEISGEISLEDNKAPIVGKADVLCSGILDGWVDANGLDFVSEVLNLTTLVAVTLAAALLCTTISGCEAATEASPIEVSPVGLPWSTLLVLVENGTFRDFITGSGYEVLCLVLGINVEDTCTAALTSLLVENGTAPTGALTPAGTAATPNANCTLGGAGTGVNTVQTEARVLDTAGGEITVSSEGAGR